MAEDVNIIVTRSMAKCQRSEADDPVSTKKLVVSQEDSTSGSNISTRWFGNLWYNFLLYGKRVLTNIKNACGLHKVAADSTVTNVEVNILDTDSTEHYERLSVVKTSLSFACKNRPVYGRLVSEKIKELAQKIVIRLLEDKVEVPKLSTGQDGILRYCFKLFLSDSTLETKISEMKRLRAQIKEYAEEVLTNIKNACGLHKVAADSTVTNVEVNILDIDSTEHYERLSVVKTSLSSACKNRPVYGRLVSEKIEELAQKIGSIRYHTSGFLNYLVIRLLEDKFEVPKLSTGQDGILRYCFKLFSSDSTLETKISEMKRLRAQIEEYAEEYRTKSGLKNLDAVSMAGFSQILASVVDKYQVGIKQHVSVNLFRKLKRYIQWRLQQQNAKLYTSNSRSAKAALYVITMVQFSQKLHDLVNEKKFKHLTEQEITDELNGMVKKILEFLGPLKLSGLLDLVNEKKFNHLTEQEITDELNGMVKKILEFLGPLKLSGVSIKAGFWKYHKFMQKISGEFYANYETDAARRFERKGSGKQFAFSINSDGVYVSIHLKQTAQSSVMKDYGFRICDEYRYESIDLNGKTIVGIDPGKSQVFCAV
ncbi:hypothetical protein MP638_006691 [Amoeboaphelidium occidentale]|nr:hypothetical protein MP638_006691 [Amoeboaphelidium occidentale]